MKNTIKKGVYGGDYQNLSLWQLKVTLLSEVENYNRKPKIINFNLLSLLCEY